MNDYLEVRNLSKSFEEFRKKREQNGKIYLKSK